MPAANPEGRPLPHRLCPVPRCHQQTHVADLLCQSHQREQKTLCLGAAKKERLVLCLFRFLLVKYHLLKGTGSFSHSQKDITLALIPVLELSHL